MHGVSNHHRRKVLLSFERLTTWLPRACSMAPKGVSRKCPEMLGNPRIPLHYPPLSPLHVLMQTHSRIFTEKNNQRNR
eukprot:jgi/Botrbrau1/589/Bobra.0010s0054.1